MWLVGIIGQVSVVLKVGGLRELEKKKVRVMGY